MKLQTANNILKRVVGDRWYFERRGNKIWFMEKLINTYNRVFPCTDYDGRLSEDVRDWHVHFARKFVNRKRRHEKRHMFDKRGKVVSGYQYDDRQADKSELGLTDDGDQLAL